MTSAVVQKKTLLKTVSCFAIYEVFKFIIFNSLDNMKVLKLSFYVTKYFPDEEMNALELHHWPIICQKNIHKTC